MADLTVGLGKDFSTLAAAVAASAAGDAILIDAGTYIDDFATVNHALTIRAVGGMAHLLAQSQPPNGKAILVSRADLTLDHIEFSGTTVPDGNGAGIRYEGGNLVITDSWFHNNQNGILAAPVANGTISIDRSEFNNNGTGTGLTHNLYVNEIARLTITNSFFHDVSVGHEIKSRARETIITNNRIADGPDLSASYSIDLPDGGAATITGNTIEKGAQAQNRTFIHLGGERNPSYDTTSLLVQNNVFINSQTAGPPTVLRNDSVVNGANAPAAIFGNTFHGITAGQVVIGTATVSANSFATGAFPTIDTSHPFSPSAPCFVVGTRLATARGEIAVEKIEPGAFLALADGGTREVRWVGQRRLDTARHPRPWDVMPVRILAGAFRPGQPGRDLLLSPDHAVFVDGALVPIRYLLNGATVVQEWADSTHYFHVELADAKGGAVHGVVLAEGLPAESYLDTGNRTAFSNGGPTLALHPCFEPAEAIWQRRACAPLLRDGAGLAMIRRRLLARAAVLGHRQTDDPMLSLEVAGQLLAPRQEADSLVFHLPHPASHAVLRSRVFVPAHSTGASDDHRRLGVAVAGIRLDGAPLEMGRLGRGWHAAEPDHRWSTGAGVIPLGGARHLRVLLGPPGRYWVENGIMARAAG